MRTADRCAGALRARGPARASGHRGEHPQRPSRRGDSVELTRPVHGDAGGRLARGRVRGAGARAPDASARPRRAAPLRRERRSHAVDGLTRTARAVAHRHDHAGGSAQPRRADGSDRMAAAAGAEPRPPRRAGAGRRGACGELHSGRLTRGPGARQRARPVHAPGVGAVSLAARRGGAAPTGMGARRVRARNKQPARHAGRRGRACPLVRAGHGRAELARRLRRTAGPGSGGARPASVPPGSLPPRPPAEDRADARLAAQPPRLPARVAAHRHARAPSREPRPAGAHR